MAAVKALGGTLRNRLVSREPHGEITRGSKHLLEHAYARAVTDDVRVERELEQPSLGVCSSKFGEPHS